MRTVAAIPMDMKQTFRCSLTVIGKDLGDSSLHAILSAQLSG